MREDFAFAYSKLLSFPPRVVSVCSCAGACSSGRVCGALGGCRARRRPTHALGSRGHTAARGGAQRQRTAASGGARRTRALRSARASQRQQGGWRSRAGRAQPQQEAHARQAAWLVHPAQLGGQLPASFSFLYFFKKNYKNIFWVLDFTVLYAYRPAGGRQGAYRLAGGR